MSIQILPEDPNPASLRKNPTYPQIRFTYRQWNITSWGGAVHLHFDGANFDRPLTADELRKASQLLAQAADELEATK